MRPTYGPACCAIHDMMGYGRILSVALLHHTCLLDLDLGGGVDDDETDAEYADQEDKRIVLEQVWCQPVNVRPAAPPKSTASHPSLATFGERSGSDFLFHNQWALWSMLDTPGTGVSELQRPSEQRRARVSCISVQGNTVDYGDALSYPEGTVPHKARLARAAYPPFNARSRDSSSSALATTLILRPVRAVFIHNRPFN